MNLHEFQAKELLKKYNVPVQEGIACGTVHEAEEAYRQGKILYGEREYEQAKDLFIKARIAAEKSENSARLIRLRNGEVL